MDWQNDPELESLFKDELDERAGSLAEGANAMIAEQITGELAGRMLREGHTIKGTGRVMGYEGIARGGETCEIVWRFIQQGDLKPSAMLGRTLLLLADSIPNALAGDPSGVSESIETVRALIADEKLLGQLPEPLETAERRPIDSPESTEEVSEEGQVVIDPPLETRDAEDQSTDVDEPVDETHVEEIPVVLDVVPDLEVPEEAVSEAPETDVAIGAAQEIESEAVSVEEAVADDESISEDVPEPAPESEADVEISVEVLDPADSDEPLVFEPGPDGRLPTPTITYEFVADDVASNETPADSSEPLSAPPTLSVVGESKSVLDPDINQSYDLGGLVGAVETWATEESVPVNAGRLFRMINDVAAVRIDIDAAVKQTSQVLSSAGGVGGAAESALESLESIRRTSVQLESAALGLTVVPVSSITSTLPQLVKYLSKKVQREVQLVVEGADTLIDRQLLDRIGEIIRQLVVNAVTHGLESESVRAGAGKASLGVVRVSASRDDQHIQLVVADDGAGIDWGAVRTKAIESGLVGEDPTSDELRSVLYTDGFSTNPESSEFTGSGSGLGRVTEIVEEVFGSMTLDSALGRGTSFVVTMPAHRALQRAQMFTAGERTWGIPDSAVVDVIPITGVSISVTEKGSSIGFREDSVPYSSFSAVAGLEVEGLPAQVMIIQSPTGPIALAVDDVLDTHEVATKDLGPLLSGSSVVSGVALLGGDDTVMLVDAGRLAERLRSSEVQSEGPVRRVLVVDDSQGVRQVVSGVLASHGFSTVSAGSVSDALAALAKSDVDALVVDFSMPRADGVALVHMVRQRYGAIPIVMLSGVASEEDRSRAERAGVDAFFDKADFAKGALVETLRGLIDESVVENGESGESVRAS